MISKPSSVCTALYSISASNATAAARQRPPSRLEPLRAVAGTRSMVSRRKSSIWPTKIAPITVMMVSGTMYEALYTME